MSSGPTGGVTIEEEMRRSYLDYAMSVIVARALPDVRDGLKPVHRRILYAMKELGYDWNRPYRKSARIVGDVMGKYHPHGDSAIYDAMVRMAQDFSMRLQLVDGQGNFGSMDGDPPAAMRYTEARLQRVASEALLEDIDRDTVDFQVNYDESTSEPTVVPARFPNLLVNGAGGIAVGMATNIPPHNLGEVIDACCALVDDPEASDETLMQLVPGPDFPTGGLILGRSGIGSAYRTGRGSVLMRARTHIEELPREREAIIVTEVPYQVNKARMLERIAEVVREKIVEGISEIRDESDRHGLRVVIELRRDAVSDVILNQLYRYTPLQTSFGVNMLAIDSGRPRMMTLREVIVAFVRFREEVIARRTAYELNKARERAHVLVGLAIAVANIDEVIALIRHAPDPDTARAGLLGRSWPAGDVGPLVDLIDDPGHQVAEDGTYRLSEAQAKAILELRLQRLTGLERDKIAGELESLAVKIREYLAILGSRERLMEVLRAELVDIKERFGTPRRTSIEDSEFEHDIEDLIPREDMVVTVTHGGYIKRVPLSTYRAQRRGGRGRAGMAMRDEDFVSSLFVCDTHTPVLFFSSRGMVYKLKVWRLPLGTPQARGKALVNILPLQEGESITAWMALPEDESTWGAMNVMFATSAGTVRRNRLSDFTNVMANGKIAMKLEAEDGHLVAVRTCSPEDDVLLATTGGKTIRFRVDDVRVFAGRNSVGVRGIRLAPGGRVISMSILRHIEAAPEERAAYLRWAAAQRRAENGNGDAEGEDLAEEAAGEVELSAERLAELQAAEEFLLSVSDDGFGKRTSAYEYRVTGRGGQGIGNLDLSRSGGRSAGVSAVFPVGPGDQIMLVTDAGQLIRTGVEDIRIAGRTTRGVTLFRVAEGERVVSVAHMADLDTEEGDEAEEGDETEDAGETQAAPEGEGPDAPRASDAPDDEAPDDDA
ncbi:DNA gyrase subunit A [Aquibaculum sediminis]|uniref:DNA gyrase subunit A n=1 Tax=Aquibaculum sediminis TaxID=3231907 RepID=UPI0034547C32